jgi:hypothetical protein
MDSKISQLPSATKIYDHDLLIAVTGYDIAGAYPDNVKVSFDRIRNDIVRLNEMIFLLSGFSGYYNSGNNTITITTHQREGNLIDLTYDNDYPYIQNIATTGINLKTENLLVKEYETTWPYTGILYNTGLNAIAGNHIEIQFSTNSPANSGYGGAGGKYFTGIISTTGLNATVGTGLYFKANPNWPHSYEIGILEKVYEISNTYNVPIGTTSLDEHLLFPLIFPQSIQSLNYTKWKCEGYYKNISMTTFLPATQPNTTGPTGQPVSWSSYTVGAITQGKLIPALFSFSYLLSNPNTKVYNPPLYVYTDLKIDTTHNNIGSKSHSHDNLFFLSFFNTLSSPTAGYSDPSGGLAFLLTEPWFTPPYAILYWSGTYNNSGTPISIGGEAIATGYVTNITVNGHRFLEIKAV